jgi:hypothetical protein
MAKPSSKSSCKICPTKRAPDAGESGAIPSLFLRLSIFPVGRRPAARPSAGNANRWLAVQIKSGAKITISKPDTFMIIIMFFLLYVAVLGIVVYIYLRREQDKFIPKDEYTMRHGMNFLKIHSPKKSDLHAKEFGIFFLGLISTIAFILFFPYVMREAATVEVNKSFNELQNILHYNYYETATNDVCFKGQNNWKVWDGYAYRCSLRITKFYGFNGDFRQQMVDFEKKNLSAGWKPYSEPDNPCEKMLKVYYDPYPEKLVSNLPNFDCRYEKDGLLLEPGFAEKETRDFSRLDYNQRVSGSTLDVIYFEENFQDSSLVIKKITNTDRYVLVISIQIDYFQI